MSVSAGQRVMITRLIRTDGYHPFGYHEVLLCTICRQTHPIDTGHHVLLPGVEHRCGDLLNEAVWIIPPPPEVTR